MDVRSFKLSAKARCFAKKNQSKMCAHCNIPLSDKLVIERFLNLKERILRKLLNDAAVFHIAERGWHPYVSVYVGDEAFDEICLCCAIKLNYPFQGLDGKIFPLKKDDFGTDDQGDL